MNLKPFELHGHFYSRDMKEKYQRNIASVCINDQCKKLHTSRHERCKDCRSTVCRKCKKFVTDIGLRICKTCMTRLARCSKVEGSE